MEPPRPATTIREHSNARGYAIALLLTAAAVWGSVAWPLLQVRPFAAPLAAIILSAWFAGFRPAVFSIFTSIVAVNIHIALTTPGGWGLFQLTQAAVATGIAVLIAAFARARETSGREARRHGARLEAMFGQASLGISLLSLDGRLTRVNQRMADIIGRSIDES